MQDLQYMQEDEIDLKECIKVLIKRKKLVLIIFIVLVVAAALANLWIPKVYEVTSTIQLGSIDGVLIKKEEAKDIILNQKLLLTIIKELDLKNGVDDLKKNITVCDVAMTDLLKIVIIYPDLNKAFKINETLANSLINQGRIIYQEQLSLAKKRLNELDEKIKDINKKRNQKQIRLYEDSKVKDNIIELWKQRNNLNVLIVKARDFEIIQPVNSMNQIKRNAEKVLAAGVAILLLGVLSIFLFEFYQTDKKREIK